MKNAEEVSKWSSLIKYFWVLIPLAVYGLIVVVVAVAYCFFSWHIGEVMSGTAASAMDAALAHVAGGMQPLLEANRSAFAVANALQLTTNRAAFPHVGPKLFMAFAMQPRLAEMSYAGVDGVVFSYYRGEDGQARAMFTSPRGRWYTQAADPVTGRLIGSTATAAAMPEHLPNATQVLLDAKNGSCASVGAGSWARPGVRMLFFSAPVGDAGVVSAAVAVDDVVAVRGAASRRAAGFHAAHVYYAIGGDKGSAPTAYEPLLADDQSDDAEEMMGSFSKIKCTASAIDAPKLELHVARSDWYKVACTNFDVSGVKLGFRLVVWDWHEAAIFRRMGVAVICFVCSMVVAAMAVCFLMARALRRAAAREAVLNAELVRQKEALRQAERKSMNKSNAFASASHDIRSALAAVAGLIEVSRPEAHANPNVTDNLNQMEVCTKKLFDILNTILDTSKVESGKMQLEEVEFSMADVLEESVDMANVVGIHKGVEVVWDPCDFSVLRCGGVVGDCKRFKQILDNLLGNAMKFTEEGHVVLRAWANRPIARSSISAPSRFARRSRGCGGGFLGWLFGARDDGSEQQNPCSSLQNDPNSIEFYFEVVDTGVGIPKEKRESVFENYVQVKEGHGGTGLGLGIVQSFVRLMGGEISIKDKEPGETGTCFGFNVFLKISDRQEVEEDIERGAAATSSSKTSDSEVRASLFREASCFKGGHCLLLVHGDETRRILQTWMESTGMKVWLVPRAELIASTLEKVHSAGASPSRASSSQGGGVHCDTTDRCFSSKEMVSQVLPMALRNSNSLGGNFGGHHPFGLLVIVDVSNGGFDDICREVASLAKMKHQAPCKVVCFADLKTSSEDFKRFMEMSCDLVLRKPVHGSRLYALLRTMRDLHVTPSQHPSQVGPESAGASQQDLPGVAMKQLEDQTAASAEIACLAAQEPKVEDDKPLDGMRALLVEDTLVLQTIQKKMLSQLGATVETAGDGSKAVDMFRQALEHASVSEDHTVNLPYDVVFMDCQMPLMDGYEATKRIREVENRHGIHTPIIALTAHAMEEDLQEAIQAGMDLYLTKPIERKRIIEAVYQICKDKN